MAGNRHTDTAGERLILIALIGLGIALAAVGILRATPEHRLVYGDFRGPVCEWCNATNQLEVHHIRTQANIKRMVANGEITLARAEELTNSDPSNLITLCRIDHFIIGHCADRWATENPHVRKMVEKNKERREKVGL